MFSDDMHRAKCKYTTFDSVRQVREVESVVNALYIAIAVPVVALIAVTVILLRAIDRNERVKARFWGRRLGFTIETERSKYNTDSHL